jgi:hypothetical protein
VRLNARPQATWTGLRLLFERFTLARPSWLVFLSPARCAGVNDVTNWLRRYPDTVGRSLAGKMQPPGGSCVHVPAVAIYVWWLVEGRAAETAAHAVHGICSREIANALSDESVPHVWVQRCQCNDDARRGCIGHGGDCSMCLTGRASGCLCEEQARFAGEIWELVSNHGHGRVHSPQCAVVVSQCGRVQSSAVQRSRGQQEAAESGKRGRRRLAWVIHLRPTKEALTLHTRLPLARTCLP